MQRRQEITGLAAQGSVTPKLISGVSTVYSQFYIITNEVTWRWIHHTDYQWMGKEPWNSILSNSFSEITLFLSYLIFLILDVT